MSSWSIGEPYGNASELAYACDKLEGIAHGVKRTIWTLADGRATDLIDERYDASFSFFPEDDIDLIDDPHSPGSDEARASVDTRKREAKGLRTAHPGTGVSMLPSPTPGRDHGSSEPPTAFSRTSCGGTGV